MLDVLYIYVDEYQLGLSFDPLITLYKTGPGPHKVMLRMKNKEKDTALHEAVRNGNYEVVRLLIKEDPNFTYGANDSGTTPLYMAAERGLAHFVKLIIDTSKETGTSPPYVGFMGRTALHAAVICDDYGSILTILMIMLSPHM